MYKNVISAILSGFLINCNSFLFGIENAVKTSKNELIYEITSFDLVENRLCIEGWAFNNENQHFLDDTTHRIMIELKAPNESHVYTASLRNIDQTDLMKYQGSRMCKMDEYFKSASYCNYDYKNVGFQVSIDLTDLNRDQTYIAYLIVEGKNCKRITKTPIYCPMSSDYIEENMGSRIRIHSSLDDMKLTINAETVFARTAPYKSAAVFKQGESCSVSYGNALYFKKDTVFQNILEKAFYNNTSYYRVNAELDVCFNNRRRIKEGTSIKNVWIASPFVNYSGSMMQIIIEEINHLPIIIGPEYIKIELYENFNILDYVSAEDQEDGNISELIHIISGEVNTHIEGIYELILKVTDSQGASNQKNIIIEVIEPENYTPVINAEDLVLFQYDDYDPKDHVSAYDQEDGDLTAFINYTSNVDTDFVGDYQTMYQVSDFNGLTAQKAVNIYVVENAKYEKKIRFIDPKSYPNYDHVALNWKKHLDKLIYECTNTNVYISIDFN